ncbi:DUF5667 domain-containing protein [Bacillus sp. AFS088145]|uniref:DUF5667 domain-containing protein n=1 Tax=Bacillus sp. AFS088145 TaxID=2033514 RepID=UPI000BF44DDA|nr:DUF5667 domain-containing protein [Bacillus sp. AFS088145]PFH91987.1 hypothetical protein COI44_01060 [Bacillus sp. AFS088145]
MKKLLVHTTATALLLSQLGFSSSVLAAENDTVSPTDQKEEAPALVKGDFFYFVKTTVEKIQLLLTTDKVKEAELLAQFAQERIHEARELIKEGKEDLAKETLKEALSQMDNAQGQLDGKLPTVTEPTTSETTTEGTVTTKPAEDSTEVEKEDTEKVETDKQDTDKQEVEKEDQEKAETDKQETEKEDQEKAETDKHEKQKLTKEQKEIAKIQHHLNNNLLVLANVLDQVKNPKAKAAIAKNIEKSFNKISERLEKVLKHTEQDSTALKPVITVQYPDATTDQSATPEVITTVTKIEDVNDTDVKNVNEDDQGENDDKNDAAEVATKPVTVEHKEEHQHKSKEVKPAKVKKVKIENEEKHVVKHEEKHEVKHEEKHVVKHENGTNHRNQGEHENRGNHKVNEKQEWKKNENSNSQGENHGNGHGKK